jgi:UDP-glucose 4-epimerase
MKQLLITGGLGFIGTNLIAAIRKNGNYRVTIFDNQTNPSGDLELSSDIELVVGDIRNKELLEQVMSGQDAVVHLAADTRVIDSIDQPMFNFDVNVIGTLNLLEAMRRHNVGLLVNASTGGAIIGEVPPPVHEDMVACPASPYGASKLAVEGYCTAYASSYGIKSISLRFSNIFGRHSKKKKSVVAAFLQGIVKNGYIDVFGDGSQTRDYLFVDDLAAGILRAMQTEQLEGVFQLGSGIPTSLNELIEVIRSIVPKKFRVDYHNFRAGEVKHTYCNIEKSRNAFGFRPETKLEDGIRATWDWYRNNLE